MHFPANADERRQKDKRPVTDHWPDNSTFWRDKRVVTGGQGTPINAD